MKRGLNKENSLPDPEFGGESSESARAIHYVVQKDTLMTYVSARFAQADPGIVSGSTIERKQMSTKTSFKRIALVAVVGLVSGLVSVAPASAALLSTTSAPDVLTMTTPTVTTTVGSAVSSTFSMSATEAGNGTLFGGAQISITKPTGSTVTLTDKNGNGTADDPIAQTTGAASMTTTIEDDAANDKTQFKFVMANAVAATATNVAGTVGFTPDRPGTYTITVTGLTDGAASAATVDTAVSTTFTVTVRSLAYTTGDGAAVSPFNTGNGIAGAFNTVTVTAHSTQVANVRSLVTVDGAGATISTGGTVAADFKSTLVAAASSAAIVIKTPTAGTITVSQFNETAASSGLFSTTAANTVTITVGATAVKGTLSVANSTAVVDSSSVDGASFNNSTTVDETILVAKNAGTVANNNTEEVGLIKVVLKDSLTNAMPDATLVTATIAGSGNLGIGTSEPTSGTGRAVSVATASANGTVYVAIYRDGTEGTGTVTISVGTTVVATKTATFYGTATKYVAAVKKQHVANSGSPTAGVVEVTATDKAGNLVPSATIGASVGTSTIATVTASASTNSLGVATFSVTGLATKFGSVVITFADSATAPTVSTTATVGVSSVLAKTVAAAVTAAPTPGAPITWTLTFKDANGLGLPDGDYAAGTLLANSAANPVASASLASTPFAGNATISLVAGVATAKGFAPLTAGPVSYTWTLAGTAGAADSANLVTALQATTVTASTTVAQNADISAITTLINSLIAKINALSKLVAKIQKKVKA